MLVLLCLSSCGPTATAAVVTQYLRLLFFLPYLQSQKISIFHLNPQAHTHVHADAQTHSQQKINATADCTFPYSARCWCWMLLWFRRTYKASHVTHFCTFLPANRLFAFYCYRFFCFFLFFFLFNNNFSRKFSSFLYVCYLFSFQQPWVSVLRVLLAFSPTMHYSFGPRFRNYSEAHHALWERN